MKKLFPNKSEYLTLGGNMFGRRIVGLNFFVVVILVVDIVVVLIFLLWVNKLDILSSRPDCM